MSLSVASGAGWIAQMISGLAGASPYGAMATGALQELQAIGQDLAGGSQAASSGSTATGATTASTAATLSPSSTPSSQFSFATLASLLSAQTIGHSRHRHPIPPDDQAGSIATPTSANAQAASGGEMAIAAANSTSASTTATASA